MKLTDNEQRNILKQFPHLELSYEKKMHKKVHSDICLTIPWNVCYNRKNVNANW